MTARTLLVTNDFPPKVGGIQSYLGELWRRLDPTATSVLTASSHAEAGRYDAGLLEGGLVVERVRGRTLYAPTPRAARRVDAAIERHRPDLVLYDPAVPLGLLGRRRGVPYGVVVHGAELTFPARLPGLAAVARRVVRGADAVVCAGGYPEHEVRRLVGGRLPGVVQVPPGVDVATYAPLTEAERAGRRAAFGFEPSDTVVVSVGRLVPRKGLDVLIEAVGRVSGRHVRLVVAVAGAGRDLGRLRRLAAQSRVDVRFLGRVDDDEKRALLGSADLFAQPCRSRWLGLEQEGFGIAFLEAAACGLPALAGRSGGSDEAVEDGVTGLVLDDPRDPSSVAAALDRLLSDRAALAQMGREARERAVEEFDYARLARRLQEGLDAVLDAAGPHHGSGSRPR